MVSKIRIFCFFVFLLGVGMFFIVARVISGTSSVFPWLIGVASALIILGLGYFINSLLEFKSLQRGEQHIGFKEKAGYLVCKIMSLLLCIYLLLINALNADRIILLLGIALVVIQYILDLALQIFYANRREK